MLDSQSANARWQRAGLPLLIETLAEACGATRHITLGEPPVAPAMSESLPQWIDAACAHLGLEAEPARASVKDVESSLTESAPALLALPDGGFAGLVAVRRGMAHLITTEMGVTTVPLAVLRDLLCAQAESRFAAETDQILKGCRASLPSPDRAKRALVRERAAATPVELGWQMRTRPGSGFWHQLVQSGLHARLAVFVSAYAAEYLISLGAWWLVGKAALTGVFDAGWLVAWVIMMACALMFRIAKTSASEKAAVGFGGLLKQRLLAGALRLDPDSVRHQGAGGMLAKVLESQSLQSLALGGGLAALTAPFELAFAAVLLWFGAGGPLHAAFLLAWVAVLAVFILRDFRCRAAWTGARLQMTDDLVDRMNGHRTRLAQEQPERWHSGEDQALAEYLDRASELDSSTQRVNTLAPRLWLMLGLAALAPAFLHSASPTSLALSVAAVLLAQRSLRALASGLGSLCGAALAWMQIGPLFASAATPVDQGVVAVPARHAEGTVLEAHDLNFRFPGRSEPVLNGCDLTIAQGDWIMLEGASGNGKSTLASLLTGLRKPDSGLLLSGGLDRRTLGESRWRSRIAYAPQSYENHIFSGSLAFNLLMGRSWPPTHKDLNEAQEVCHDLGLENLLAQMPAGLNQMVGESGWQLSEGERSRVFLGRTLLAGGDLFVLDECFSALDPESLQTSYEALRRRASTVLMVAHP